VRKLSFDSVVIAVALSALAGCSESEPASPEAEGQAGQEQEFVARGGMTLKAPTDADLRISLMMLDGVRAQTKNQRFVKATVLRGSKSFGAFCDLTGSIEKDSQSAKVSCNIGVATVSGDDDESLSFDVVLSRTPDGESVVLSNVSYAGDGTFLGNEARIIGHDNDRPVPLTVQEANNVDKNAFQFARVLLDATKPLLAERVISEEVNAPVVVKSADFHVDTKLNVSVSLTLGRTGQLSTSLAPQSVLTSPGELSTGVLAASGITKRLKAALPR
jgi:hypothetical protein